MNGGLVRLSARWPTATWWRSSPRVEPGPSGLAGIGAHAERGGADPAWFAEQSRDVVIERGRHALEVAFAAAGGVSLDGAVEDGSLLVTTLELGHRHLEELYAAVADRRVDAEHVVARSAAHAPPA